MTRSTDTYIDPTAQVAKDAAIGKGTRIWSHSRVQAGAVIGERCQLGTNVYVDRSVHIGRRTKVQNNVSIYAGVTVGDGVFLGPSCVFTNVTFPRAVIERKAEFTPTIIERGVTVGANATIVCGVTLREFSFIGAGALVSRDVPAFAMVVGSPARRLGWACACGERLPATTGPQRCDRCGLTYQVSSAECRPDDREAFEAWWRERLEA